MLLCGGVAVWRCGGVAVWRCGTIRGDVRLVTTATEDVEVLNCGQKKSPPEWGFFSETLLQISAFSYAFHYKYGGRYWDRTSDPLLVREVLSQLS